LARLCEHHDAYRWLCGGVSVNYHGLSDFRVAHPERLELRAVDLDSLIDADHSARLFWDYVQKLDLSAVEGARACISPEVWINAAGRPWL
jgi:hypothetical protein